MEGRVENGHLREFGPQRAAEAHGREIRRIVEGSERGKCLDLCNSRVVEDSRRGKFAAAMRDPVTDRVDFVQPEALQHRRYRGDRGAYVGMLSPAPLVDLVLAKAEVASAVAKAVVGALEYLLHLFIEAEDPEFETGAACIEHEYLHLALILCPASACRRR